MIDFKEVYIEDKLWIDPLFKTIKNSGSHQNFANIFTWAKITGMRVANINGYLAVKSGKGKRQGYHFPVGTGDIKLVIDELMHDAKECGHDFIFYALTKDNIALLDSIYPGYFTYKPVRDAYDYVYLIDKMVSLSGKKLHAKRNHINYFLKNHQWSFEPITPDNIDECKQMNEEWCKQENCSDEDGLKRENCATRRYFKYYDDLGVEGGIIRAEGKVIAFTIGELLNTDTYIIHLEKAFKNIQGAYQMINREFASHIKEKYPDLIWINREEDMGYAGLRKAKESYYPDKMVEKFRGMLIKDSGVSKDKDL